MEEMRTIKDIELRKGGWLYQKIDNFEYQKVLPEEALNVLFYFINFSNNLLFDDFLKMFENYPDFRKINPYINEILYDKTDYEELINLNSEGNLEKLVFEQHVTDAIDFYIDRYHLFGMKEDYEETMTRYQLACYHVDQLRSIKIEMGQFIVLYEPDDPKEPSQISISDTIENIPLVQVINTFVVELGEAGKNIEKINILKSILENIEKYKESKDSKVIELQIGKNKD